MTSTASRGAVRMVASDSLYEPPDVREAFKDWGANCGPCAYAAFRNKPVWEVRRLFPAFGRKQYTNPTDMISAFKLDGVRQHKASAVAAYTKCLAFLQIGGPWCNSGVPPVVAYKHTHWVATANTSDCGLMFYEMNAACGNGQWVPQGWWAKNMLPLIVDSKACADGRWWVKTALTTLDM